MLADWRGTPIVVGSRVVYARSGYSRDPDIYIGEVISIESNTTPYELHKWVVTVRDTIHPDKKPSPLRNLSNMLVLTPDLFI